MKSKKFIVNVLMVSLLTASTSSFAANNHAPQKSPLEVAAESAEKVVPYAPAIVAGVGAALFGPILAIPAAVAGLAFMYHQHDGDFNKMAIYSASHVDKVMMAIVVYLPVRKIMTQFQRLGQFEKDLTHQTQLVLKAKADADKRVAAVEARYDAAVPAGFGDKIAELSAMFAHQGTLLVGATNRATTLEGYISSVAEQLTPGATERK